MHVDARILFCNKIARALAFGLSSVVLAQFLSIIGLEDGRWVWADVNLY